MRRAERIQRRERAFTLAEMLVSAVIMGIIATASASLLTAFTQSYEYGCSKTELYREGLALMERLTSKIRGATFILIPNASTPSRDILALSGFFNDDDDYYFDDPLFPRIDEDFAPDMNEDGANGIAGIDDDGDGAVDEPWFAEMSCNDDEDSGGINEDPIDGVDNDGDGNVDEDCGSDSNDDGAPGVRGIDDDNDGSVDEGVYYDDDEDGSTGEVGLIPLIYSWDSGTQTLTESCPYRDTSVDLCDHVTTFTVGFASPGEIVIRLVLTDENGETVSFSESTFPRNTYERTGKRVR